MDDQMKARLEAIILEMVSKEAFPEDLASLAFLAKTGSTAEPPENFNAERYIERLIARQAVKRHIEEVNKLITDNPSLRVKLNINTRHLFLDEGN